MEGGYLLFNTSSELVRVPAHALVYVEADGNYSVAYTSDGAKYMLSMQLGHVENHIANSLLEGQGTFIRVGKSLIVNYAHITYVLPKRKLLVLSDARSFRCEVSASREALKDLKDFVEGRECFRKGGS